MPRNLTKEDSLCDLMSAIQTEERKKRAQRLQSDPGCLAREKGDDDDDDGEVRRRYTMILNLTCGIAPSLRNAATA